MSAVTSPLRPWHALMTKVPYIPLLTFLLVSLPLTAISIYVLPYFEYALPKFIWMVVLVLAVLLFQIRASMDHPTNKYLNSLTSYPINFVSLSTIFAGFLAFSKYPTVAQSVTAVFLILSTILYGAHAVLQNRQDSHVYRLLTRRGSALVQFLVIFALVMAAVWLLPNPAQAQQEASRHGPAAPWQTQLAVAQERAISVNKDAILVHITASPIYANKEDYTTALNTRFYFVDATGPLFKVVLDDINPAGTVEVESVTELDDTRATFDKDSLDKALSLQASIFASKLSPRDALLITVPEVTSIAQQNNTDWTFPWIELDITNINTNSTPQWRVEHTIKSGITGQNWWIDTITGEITAHQIQEQ